MNSLSIQLPITICLFPVKPIKRTSFDTYISKLRQCNRLSLADVPLQHPAQSQESATVFINFVGPSTPIEPSEQAHPIRQVPLASIGIVDCSEWVDLCDAHFEYERCLQQRPGPSSLCSRCYAFNPKEEHRDHKDLIIVPSVGDQQFYISALLADMVASIVTELNTISSQLEKPLPPSSSTNSLKSDSISWITPSSSKQDLATTSLSSSQTNSPSKQQQQQGQSADTQLEEIPQNVRDCIRSNVLSPIHPSTHPKPGSKLLQGRISKLKGDTFLSSGQWSEALKCYRECSNLSKSQNDYLWQAAALEGIVAAQILQGWQLAIANNRPPNSKPSFVDLHSAYSTYSLAINLYSTPSSPSNAAEPSPPFVFATACLRAARVLYAVWLYDGWDENTLNLLVNFDTTNLSDLSRKYDLGGNSSVSKSEAAYYAGLPLSPLLINRLTLQRRLFILSNAALLLGLLKSFRKRAVVLRLVSALVAEKGVDVKEMLSEMLAAYESQNMSYDLESTTALNDYSNSTSSHGWQQLQAAVLHDAITIAEIVPDYELVLKLAIKALPLAPAIDQRSIKDSIDRVYGASKRRKVKISLPYWGPRDLLISMEACSPDMEKLPVRRSQKDINIEKTPFIYNPSQNRSSTNAQLILVQNEPTQIMITLQNTFHFQLNIKKIQLSVEGVAVDTQPTPATLPPCSFHTLALEFIPKEAGTLTIKGCNVWLGDCEMVEFCVPAWSKEDDEKNRKHQSLQVEREKFKGPLLDKSRLSYSSGSQETNKQTMRYLEFDVISSLPLIRVQETSLTHGSLMLYDGEVTTVKLGLYNDSPLDVSFLNISFTDTLDTALQSYLSEAEIDPIVAHDIESDMIDRPTFSWKKPESYDIPARQMRMVEIDCVGKLGCTSANFRIVYGIGNTGNEKWGRSIEVPVSVTVRPSLVPRNLQILPFEASTTKENQPKKNTKNTSKHKRSVSVIKRATIDPLLEEELSNADGQEHCLVKVDLANVCPVAFDVEFSRKNSDGVIKGIKQTIEPGSTACLLLRIDRILLSSDVTEKPIPSLSNRQFVVSKRDIENQRIYREIFWYRLELYSTLKTTWRESGTLRKGSVRFSSLQLGKTSFECLRLDPIQLKVELEDHTGTIVGANKATPEQYYSVVAKILNRNDPKGKLNILFGLQPQELQHRAIIHGMDATDVEVEINKQTEARFNVVFLASGTFQITCSAQEIDTNIPVGHGRLQVEVNNEASK